MESISPQEKINLFKSVFKGRDDVFAVRWEKGDKSGYMPAYRYDPYLYRLHKMKGGTFNNYNEKQYLSLTDEEITKHLNGNQHIGIYPLLTDNMSWFIAADFDKENWALDCKKFIETCTQYGISAYLERSRSGKGGHVWIFFDRPYPAIRSRKIFISILEEAKIFSIFDKNSSFDRLFPNQDFHSGKGFGNLIALPLYKPTWEKDNSCFINPDTLTPITDQWGFLESIQRVSISELDKLYKNNPESKVYLSTTSGANKTGNEKLVITLNNSVHLNRSGVNLPLINFLREELNFANTEFLIKKRGGRNTWGTERYFKLIEETESEIIIPKGATGRVIRFCKETKIDFEFVEERKKKEPVLFSCNVQLRKNQNTAVEAASKKDFGVIVAPPGSGKTVIALRILADKQQPTLIVVHRKQLVEQWAERIETFLGIPKNEIGRIGHGKNKIGSKITIATIQSLAKELNSSDSKNILNTFGTIIVDECHHIPAETFRSAIAKFNCYYLYGLTATPFRKYNDGKLIFIYLGEVTAEIKPTDISTRQTPKVIVRNTELNVPFNPKIDKFETLSKILVHDSSRNKLILEDIRKELNNGKKAVVITERKEHIETLNQYLKQVYETVNLSGEDSESSRTIKWKMVKEGNYQALITTGQFFGEGSDLQNAQCLFLVYPFSFEGKLIQYIGRIQRSEIAPIVYDYRDIKIDYLNKLFLKRNTYYRKIEKVPTLFDDPIKEVKDSNTLKIEQRIKIPLEKLEFRYGSVVFKYEIPELKTEIEFDIENSEIRPEFEVLKPYFSKKLKMINVKVDIYAELENGKLISQLATCSDMKRINREIIEGVKFKFISNNFLGKSNQNKTTNLLDINQLQSDDSTIKLYDTGEELLSDLLKNKNYKHRKHLQYLAEHHERNILKIRFILNPFSFIFLLKGKEEFHLVLETLDTEEATYIWHYDNNKRNIPSKLKQVDEHLNVIKTNGRQLFLENPPQNFSRIVHDYSDDKKGFIIWKDTLEERLF
jgi:superfamily II DNA or RNA helicase